jgi:hypothetical protein
MQDVPQEVVAGFALSLVFAIYCFRRSKEARAKLDSNGYFFWHGMWHLSIPLAGSAVIYWLCCT